MKIFSLVLRVMFFMLALTNMVSAQRKKVNYFTISGFVLDRTNGNPLTGAYVQVIAHNEPVVRGYSGDRGDFNLSTYQLLTSFKMEISFAGYETFTSNEIKADTSKPYNAGRILLNRIAVRDTSGNRQIPDVPPVQNIPVTKEEVIKDHFRGNNILPTNGAYELFYALNPELRDRKEVPRNYHIVTPEFPRFNESKRLFNERFKLDKNKEEPYISKQFEKKEALAPAIEKNNIKRPGYFLPTSLAVYSAYSSLLGKIKFQSPLLKTYDEFFFRPKKFVFVIWKYGPDRKPITQGPEVEGKYKIIYYTDRSRNVASNASYGYAPMNDAKYNIEVYDQASGTRLRVSDDIIDPGIYFERNDVFFLFNISWIRVPIQVFE